MKTAFYRTFGGVLLLVPFAGIILIVISSLGIMGCDSGTNTPQLTTRLGDPPANDVPQVSAEAVSAETVGETVRVKGEVVQQCPATGCWLILKDETGQAFVDLNPAGLRLTETHKGEQAQVVGRVAKKGSQYRLEAQSVEFGSDEPGNEKENDATTQEPDGSQERRESTAQETPEVSIGELSDAMLGKSVAVEGDVTRQCPAVGCWLSLKDHTGEVFVDLKPAGVLLTARREREHAQITGRVVKQAGQIRLEAQSVQFDADKTSDDSEQ